MRQHSAVQKVIAHDPRHALVAGTEAGRHRPGFALPQVIFKCQGTKAIKTVKWIDPIDFWPNTKLLVALFTDEQDAGTGRVGGKCECQRVLVISPFVTGFVLVNNRVSLEVFATLRAFPYIAAGPVSVTAQCEVVTEI